MKHILNNLTEEEKNSIRQQHTGGMNVVNENFNKLIDSKLGDVQPLINEAPIDDKITQMRKDNYINPDYATNARGQGAGFYKSDTEVLTTRTLKFGQDKMKSGSDEVDETTPQYRGLIQMLNDVPTPTGGKKYDIRILGGASDVGTAQGYDNKALAKRRADYFLRSLMKNVKNFNQKFTSKVTFIVGGKETSKANTKEAQEAQFVKVTVTIPKSVQVPTFIESDSTVTTHGTGGYPHTSTSEKLPFDTGTTICVTIPSGFRKSFINMLYEFKTDNNINLTYKENR